MSIKKKISQAKENDMSFAEKKGKVCHSFAEKKGKFLQFIFVKSYKFRHSENSPALFN